MPRVVPRRTRYEQELCQLLQQDGCQTLRSGGSLGPVDLVAWNRQAVLWIQVKSTATWVSDNKLPTRLADAASALLALTLPELAQQRWLFLRVHGRGWYRARVDGWPTARLALLGYVQGTLRAFQAGQRVVASS